MRALGVTVAVLAATCAVACGGKGSGDSSDATTDDTAAIYRSSGSAQLLLADQTYRFDVNCEASGEETDQELLIVGPAAQGSAGVGIQVAIALQQQRGEVMANLGGEPPRRVALVETTFGREGDRWLAMGSFGDEDTGDEMQGKVEVNGCVP
jgi:hypothetical protein